MEQMPLLAEAVAIFALSIGVILLCHRLHLPSVVGFLLTGILCGPYGLGLIEEAQDVHVFADIGIILLLFTVGMEISIQQIVALRRFFIGGGLLQIFFTLTFGWLLGLVMGRANGEGLFLGCLLALSSTAIVLRMLAQRGEIDAPHGRATLAILIFQDFCAVPMMLVIPFLCEASIFHLDWLLVLSALKGISLVALSFAAASWLVPKLLYYVARTRIRELFLMAVVCICLAVAWVSSQAGLSLALGAFLAGLIISQSDFSHEAIGNIVPFQDLFTSFFFVSIGMLLDVNFVWQHPVIIVALAALVIVIKTTATTLASVAVGMPLRSAALVGLSLAQISEFSFVLAKEGMGYDLMASHEYQLFLAVSLLTMAVTPWIISRSHTLAGWIHNLPLPDRYKRGWQAAAVPSTTAEVLEQHVVIIGFGLTGRTLAQSCRAAQLPYVIVEMNAQTVRKELQNKEPIYYGDASHESVLEHIKIEHAKAAAIVINDAAAAMRILKQIKHLNPNLYIVVRTRYMQDVARLYELGANDVIPDECGAAVEVFTRVLHNCAVDKEHINQLVMNTLADGYNVHRMNYLPLVTSEAYMLSETVALKAVRMKEHSHLSRPLGQWDFLSQTGVSVIALQRGTESVTSIDGSLLVKPDDRVVLMGSIDALQAVSKEFSL